MQRIITALVLIPLVLLLILRAPGPAIVFVAAMVALLAIREFLAIIRQYGIEPHAVGAYVYTAIFFAVLLAAAVRNHGSLDLAPWLMALFAGLFAALAPFVFLTLGLTRGVLASIYPSAAASVFAFAYIALPMGLVVALRQSPMGEFHVVYLMLVVWSGDIFAYFVGKSIGRSKMSPRISPKKTWEGAAASLLASIVCGTSLYLYALPLSLGLSRLLGRGEAGWDQPDLAIWKVVLLSALLNIAAQFGDLVESAIKRGAEIKDSGSILPGHGGMLDRIDAMLFAAPVLWFFVGWGLVQ